MCNLQFKMILIVYYAVCTNIVALSVRVYVCYLKSHLSTCRLILFFLIIVISTVRLDVISCLNLSEYTLLYAYTFKANVHSVECHQLRRSTQLSVAGREHRIVCDVRTSSALLDLCQRADVNDCTDHQLVSRVAADCWLVCPRSLASSRHLCTV